MTPSTAAPYKCKSPTSEILVFKIVTRVDLPSSRSVVCTVSRVSNDFPLMSGKYNARYTHVSWPYISETSTHILSD